MGRRTGGGTAVGRGLRGTAALTALLALVTGAATPAGAQPPAGPRGSAAGETVLPSPTGRLPSVLHPEWAGPWSPARSVGEELDPGIFARMATTSDGTAVAIWHEYLRAAGVTRIITGVRRAGDREWTFGTLDSFEGRGYPVLAVGQDGAVHAAWVAQLSDGFGEVRTAAWKAGARAWTARSAPYPVHSEAANISNLSVSVPRTGRVALSWTAGYDRERPQAYFAERSRRSGEWSAPESLPVAGTADPASVRLLHTPGGELSVISSDDEGVHLRSRPAGPAGGWNAWSPAVRLSPAGKQRFHSVAVGADGTAAVTWQSGPADARSGETRYDVVVRRPGAVRWARTGAVKIYGELPRLETLVGPTGEITLIRTTREGFLRASTLGGGSRWSAEAALEREWYRGANAFQAAMGPDGTVHVNWVGTETGTGREFLRYTARAGGGWKMPTNLTGWPSTPLMSAPIAGTPHGGAVALWTPAEMETNPLYAADKGPVTPVRRDHAGSGGSPDLFSLTAKGALTVHRGTGDGDYGRRVSGGTWPAGSTVIPFGDLDRDGVNEVLVRDRGGDLRLLRPARGRAVTPSSPAVKVGHGWSGYDSLVHVGDLTGDHYPDLVARHRATGSLFLYRGTAGGGIVREGRFAGDWSGLTVIGAGNLDGDNYADLLVKDRSGVLWRRTSTGGVRLMAPTRVGSGWNGYTALVAAGDLRRDSYEDLVARDSRGGLWRFDGTGGGTFRPRVPIGEGWNGYGSLF
jgi:hypothetical protein